jgi:hypothetical protein
MCTPGDDSILIVGTVVGSLQLYDLKQFDIGSSRSEDLDYESLLQSISPPEMQ